MPPGSSFDALHEAYTHLAWTLHPDRGGDKTKFQALTAAWVVLKDEQKRALYDAQLMFDGGNCDRCLGRGLVFRYKKRKEMLCEHCKGTGRTK